MPQLIQSMLPLGPLSFVIFADNNGGQIYPTTNRTPPRDVLDAPIGLHWPGLTLDQRFMDDHSQGGSVNWVWTQDSLWGHLA
jgi:hypothetical protein